MIEKGINVNIQNNQGNTALHFAYSTGNNNLIKLLINGKADINIKNNDGKICKEINNGTFPEILDVSYNYIKKENMNKNKNEIKDNKDNNLNSDHKIVNNNDIIMNDKGQLNKSIKINWENNNFNNNDLSENNNIELKENKSNDIEEEIKLIDNNETSIKKENINKPQQQIYQPKKSIKRKSIKNMNKKIKPTKIDKNIIKRELDNEEYSPKKELLTQKGKENNLGLGITLTSSENDYKANTVKNMPSIINEPKLSTLSENELLKNIIIDTAKKIKNHNNK